MSAEEAAAAAVLSHSQGEAAREEKARQERLANSGFGKLLGRAIFEKTGMHAMQAAIPSPFPSSPPLPSTPTPFPSRQSPRTMSARRGYARRYTPHS
jgi:hypothetical protein